MEEKILSILLDIQNEQKQTKEEVLKLQNKVDNLEIQVGKTQKQLKC